MPTKLAPVGIYVHHHGSGHATRTQLLAQQWPTGAPLHVFTSAPERFSDWPASRLHALPMDYDPATGSERDHLTGQVLHYAPLHCTGVSARMLLMARWIHEQQPSLFIVDLSVEVALFVRLCGCPVALMRLHGVRSDPAHEAAFRLADALLAPFPRQLEDAHTPGWVTDKTLYLGTFSRYDGRPESKEDCRDQLDLPKTRPVVTVINGSGGDGRPVDYWSRVAADNPDQFFVLVGKITGLSRTPRNLRRAGYVSDTFPYLKAADIVIGSGGTNTLHEVAAAGARFLSLPEPRPFREQLCKMEALERYGLTRIVRTDIPPEDWKRCLLSAAGLQPECWADLRQENALAAALRQLLLRIPSRPR